jgi:hypothetical protein
MMKLFKTLIAGVFACALLATPALAESCCVKAKVKGKECDHKCCVTAHKDAKTCEKCQAEASCCDKAIAAGKACEHKCCATALKDAKVCEKCNPPAKKDAKKEEKK